MKYRMHKSKAEQSARFGTKKWDGFLIILLILLLMSCGPSPKEQAATSVALTAAAATDTPTPIPTSTPTPTPTPIPYDLSVLVTDEDGVPIMDATVVLAEVGEARGTQTTDDVGQVSWESLPGETANLSISAQGYFPTDMSKTIEPGPNEFDVVLERDPYGLLPSEACAPGENLLYIEDFQDGAAQGWDDIEMRANGWDIVSNPDEVGNLVASRPMEYQGGAGYGDQIFGDTVWRLKVTPTEALPFHLAWHWSADYEVDGNKVDWSSYQMFVDPPNIWIFRGQEPLSTVTLRETQLTLAIGVWHNIEISSFEGRFMIWVDGKELLSYDDPQPLPDGYFIIGAGFGDPMEPQAPIYYDDIVVCQLTAPFMPMPTPEHNP